MNKIQFEKLIKLIFKIKSEKFKTIFQVITFRMNNLLPNEISLNKTYTYCYTKIKISKKRTQNVKRKLLSY